MDKRKELNKYKPVEANISLTIPVPSVITVHADQNGVITLTEIKSDTRDFIVKLEIDNGN